MHRVRWSNCSNYCIILFFLMLSLLASCISPKKTLYFGDLPQDSMGVAPIVMEHTTPFVDPKIEPNDILQVTVQTIAQNEGNAPTASTSPGVKDPYAGLLVDKDGYVEVALIGPVQVAGLTTQEAKNRIRSKAMVFYKEPVVNVRIMNFDVMVLGDVTKPGTVTIPSEKASIIDVIGLAGDLSITGKRKNILMVRSEGDQKKFVRFDMTSSKIFQSPYYWVKQRDMIYVEPSEYKIQNSDNSFLRYFSITSSLVSIISLLFAVKVIK